MSVSPQALGKQSASQYPLSMLATPTSCMFPLNHTLLCRHPTAHISDKTSACSSTIFVACSCLSGG